MTILATHPNTVEGRLRIDPNGKDATRFGVYSTNTVQEYELGTRYRQGDQVFRYGKAGAALNPKWGAFNYNTWIQCGGGLGVTTQAEIGDTVVDFTIDATTGDITENQLVGGYFSQPDGTNRQFRKIIGQVGYGTVGAVVQLLLDGPLTRQLITTSWFEILQNPYSDLRNNALNQGSVMGMPTTVIANGSYGWFQTWGPCWVNPEDGNIGNAVHTRTCIFKGTSGGIALASTLGAIATTSYQIAGFVIDRGPGGAWSNPPFIWLTITP